MRVLASPSVRRAVTGSASLTVLFLIVHTAEVWNLAYRGRVWWLDCTVGLVVCGVALARELNRMLATAVGLAIAAAATVTAGIWHLPGEPGVAATLALTILVASVIRVSPTAPSAAAVTAGATALTWLTIAFHPSTGIALLGLWLACALAAGLLLRRLDDQRQTAPAVTYGAGRRSTERLTGLVGRFARRGIPVLLQIPDGPAWPPEMTSTICRVVDEAMVNITRHAALATAVTVSVSRDRDAVTVEVAGDEHRGSAGPAAPSSSSWPW